MKKLAFDNSTKAHAAVEQNDSPTCKAHGCRLLGSMDVGGSGRFICRYHQSVESKMWPRVTEVLNESMYIFDLMKDIKQARNDREWFALATEFWEEEERMQPLKGEKAGQYLYRLHYEVMFRTGTMKTNERKIIRSDVKVKPPKEFVDEPTYANDSERTESLKRIAADKVRQYMEAK